MDTMDNYKIEYPTLDLLKENSVCIDCLSNHLDEAMKILGDKAFDKGDYNLGYCFAGFKNNKLTKYGVDIPVKITKEGNDKTLYFVGESVLREKNDYNRVIHSDHNILIGTPFAVVGTNDNPKSCNVYKEIFCRFLELGYNIYITDFIKLWRDDKSCLNDINLRKSSKELLRKEIEDVNPTHIIPFGKEARDVIVDILGADNIIKLHHPSNNAKVHWKIEMYEELIESLIKNDSKDYSALIGFGIFNRVGDRKDRNVLNEDVVNFAVKKINIWISEHSQK